MPMLLRLCSVTGVDEACGHMAHFHILLGMVARQVGGQ